MTPRLKLPDGTVWAGYTRRDGSRYWMLELMPADYSGPHYIEGTICLPKPGWGWGQDAAIAWGSPSTAGVD